MELKYMLARRTIDIAVGKALEDMRHNTKRGIRNLIDLGLLFSKSENQKQFFSIVRKVAESPGNPYALLAKRIIADMNTDTIKKVGVNLGYGSLMYGAGKLKKKQDELGEPLPWFLTFDVSESSAAFFDQMSRFIKESRELGIYSYVVCPHRKDDILALCEIAKRFEDCLFVFKVPSSLISGHTADALGKTLNAASCMHIAGDGFDCESNLNAFRLLKHRRCVYGFNVCYNEKNMEQVAAPKYIDSAIRFGSLFGVYIAENGVSDECRDAVYDFVCRERSENGQPLIAFEWRRDLRYISDRILPGDGYMAIDLTKKAYCEPKIKDALPRLLFEILQKVYMQVSQKPLFCAE